MRIQCIACAGGLQLPARGCRVQIEICCSRRSIERCIAANRYNSSAQRSGNKRTGIPVSKGKIRRCRQVLSAKVEAATGPAVLRKTRRCPGRGGRDREPCIAAVLYAGEGLAGGRKRLGRSA